MTEADQQQKVDNFFKNVIKRKDSELAQLIVDRALSFPHSVEMSIGKGTVLLAIDILENRLLEKCETARGMDLKLHKDELIKLNVLKRII